ncbi:ferredoxin [Arthrobacter sunyaminii]|uniref:Ferredoxin n=1 Tax=Arthrobacter sunyaminii TaxID=2816859 RepID=A0A975XKZ2_9MICC|nr:ferredoxin [Arthrobacter sunyaminii]MBO0909817.1 ferredoxin [Arthrobacter sunyaminii]QWQ36607.1 ferredoxin [Arthrobacter sunyaminii]
MTADLTVDRDRCMGSGQCTFYAPHTFDLDDLSIAVVLDGGGDAAADVAMAINVCPTRAIVRTAGTEGNA